MGRIMGLNDREFWHKTPRNLIAMIDQWKEIEAAKHYAPAQPATADAGAFWF